MYHGHFAAALLIKALCGPSIPAWPIMFGSGILDIIGGFNGLLGLDIIRPNSKSAPYMYSDFVFIDWEHSVLMMLVWSCLFGWILCNRIAGFSKEASMIGAASAVVHYLFDILVIDKSGLTLYPHGDLHFGLGLYTKYPIGSWFIECFLCVVLVGIASSISKKKSGADISKACALLAVLSLLMSPWTSPLLLVAKLNERGLLGRSLPWIQMAGFWTAYIRASSMVLRKKHSARMDPSVWTKDRMPTNATSFHMSRASLYTGHDKSASLERCAEKMRWSHSKHETDVAYESRTGV